MSTHVMSLIRSPSLEVLRGVEEYPVSLVCCVPFIGVLPQLIKENSIQQRAASIRNPEVLDATIYVKNEYKSVGHLRRVIEIVILVALVYFGVLTGPLAICALIFSGTRVLYIGQDLCAIYKNTEIRRELQTRRFREGLQIL